MINIEKIDPNFASPCSNDIENIKWHSIHEKPFRIYGLYGRAEDGRYIRMPVEIADNVNNGVKSLNYCTAGGRVRFSTDSDYISLHISLEDIAKMRNMSTSGSSSFDLYEDFANHSSFRGAFLSNPADGKSEFESTVRFRNKKMRHFTINFPLYMGVKAVAVGLCEDAKIEEGLPYSNELPVIYYGASITQGGCASRPGLNYQEIISRRMNLNYINLGFSGNAGAGEIMAEYIAKQPCSVFVYDYVNEYLFKKVREMRPDLPIILVGKPYGWRDPSSYKKVSEIRDEIMRIYMSARDAGDKKVFYLDSFDLFHDFEDDGYTVDSVHPNDLGFMRMAESIGAAIRLFMDDVIA